MSKKIVSTRVLLLSPQTIKIPERAIVIRVGMIGQDLYIWYETPQERPPILTHLWQIDIVEDGTLVSDNCEYIGTVELNILMRYHIFISQVSIGAQEQTAMRLTAC